MNRDDNYFTVIIGNNGTGKSRYISSLVEAFRDAGENRRRMKVDYCLSYVINNEHFRIEKKHGKKALDRNTKKELFAGNGLDIPSKIIAVTTSLSDKFSSDNFNRRDYLKKRESIDYKRECYTYLGPRSTPGRASSRALMDRAMTTLIASVGEQIHNRSYRHIFDYLKYEPIVKLSYEISRPRYFQEQDGIVSGAVFKRHLEELSDRRGGMRADMFRRELESRPDQYWEDIANAYNYILGKASRPEKRLQFSFVVNFSAQNEKRENTEIVLFHEELYSFLEDLRKFDLVRGPSINLFKKDGGEFDFSDASSGEASILSTLIALIPNLDNDSLIVIDEPEISLHPSWQYKYVELIDRLISQKTGCHVVIATHSHFLISDLPLGRSHIVHFREGKKSEIDVEYIEEETNGLSAEDVLLNVFDMPSTRNYYLSKNISEALELVAEGKINSDRYQELIGAFEKYLPNLKNVDPLKDVIKALLKLGI
ncbi:ATP-binding protein [Lacimicrobium alkaliphilum]|uniref:ATP-binding protein n=1 Tax=Lacimicrobium alkaliphilum TaxID=1526571 RepID=UPI0018D1FFC5|nr:ATP-binding protein [Lacimicrobium alkaliphilum]